MTHWTSNLHVVQFRIARPTDQLAEIERFYVEGVGLTKIGRFEGHRGIHWYYDWLAGCKLSSRVYRAC